MCYNPVAFRVKKCVSIGFSIVELFLCFIHLRFLVSMLLNETENPSLSKVSHL